MDQIIQNILLFKNEKQHSILLCITHFTIYTMYILQYKNNYRYT